ncbi:MAG: 30S ribosomal protein S20 [Desulfobacterales bacterium]|nr:30S ribosomal protein S20 [Desulfobacterales bacterium]
MAIHKSAEKRMRQNETRRMRNRHIKTSIKTMVKRVREAVQEKNEVKAQEALARVIPLVDKAANHGVLHWRNGSRKISRLTRLVNTMGAKN